MADDSAAKDLGASGGNGTPKPVLLVSLVVLNMLVVAGVGIMVYQGKKKEAQQPTIDQVVRGEHDTQKAESEKDEEFIGQLIPMETFLVNLAGSRGRKILKVNLELEVASGGVQEEIEKRKPQVRDIIIILMSSKSYEQVSTAEGKEHLREEIRDTVNSFLTKGKIKKVLFTDFIYN